MSPFPAPSPIAEPLPDEEAYPEPTPLAEPLDVVMTIGVSPPDWIATGTAPVELVLFPSELIGMTFPPLPLGLLS